VRILKQLFDNNAAWAGKMLEGDPRFFDRLTQQQSPEYLWIGCSDSRVPANDIVGLLPGDLFVHRNVANIVAHTDLNCLSVLQYAVEVLRVKHVIVCGHYGCGGVEAAVRNDKLGLIDNWLRRVQEVRLKHGEALDSIIDESVLIDRMCELNVIEQVYNVSRTTIVEEAWWHGQSLTVHGWIYSLKDGLLRDLGMCASRKEEVAQSYATSVRTLADLKTSTTASLSFAPASTRSPSSGVDPRRTPPATHTSSPATAPSRSKQSAPQRPGVPPPLPRLK
jgi:carbonic anhydrase